MADVYLIRHSKTEGNLNGRYIGVTDEPLCEKGYELLKGKQFPSADRIYVSPMKRCRETAEYIYGSMPQNIVEDFRECNFGDFENKNYLELKDQKEYQKWVDSHGQLPFPNGETPEEFRGRCCEAFKIVVEDIIKENILCTACVVHGGTIMSIMERFCLLEKPFYEWQVKNARGFHLQVTKEQWKLKGKIEYRDKL